ncbi:exocyst complex component 3-like, partial [Trifolium medium]|nr:exocyst complex component 3-like [Trifolium medium]
MQDFLHNIFSATDMVFHYFFPSDPPRPLSQTPYTSFQFNSRLTALDGKRRFALAAAASHKEEVGRL